ncbi:MAG TPA: S8/S53 family peptidase [Thermoanaerobaculia bacterium]|nr:S8/S53 family peptidase [Thermoanaerobaculia bacterium]
MRRGHLLWIAVGIAIGLNACKTFPPPHLDTAKACADWRWIGISQPEAQCPEIAGWTVRPLFPQLDPVQQQCKGCKEKQTPGSGPSREVIQELNRFCVYEIADPKKKLEKLPFPLAASAKLSRLDQDCAALTPSAETKLEVKTKNLLSSHFLSQAGRLRAPIEIDSQPTVRLAFLDTQPTGEGVPRRSGKSRHGYTLAHMARHLVCTLEPNAHCAAWIATRLALPFREFDAKSQADNKADTKLGGALGMYSDLAEAIRNEVDTWRRAGSQKHLVLNLSLGWDGELFGGLDEKQIADMRAGTQAVYRALQYAAGFDVLVLAAAGNQKRDPCANIGPLLPAAWEKEALRDESCKTPEAPLIYAVGGLKSDGRPLEITRPGGMPRRAAYAENAMVPTPDPDEPAAILTGSSVATAVASSIAAVVWDSFPGLNSHQVMNILDGSGEELGFEADFWFREGTPIFLAHPKVHRLSLCTALHKARCRDLPSPCPIKLDCEPLPGPLDPSLPASAKGSCQPWLYPQPEDPPFPNCPTCPPRVH